MAPDTALPAYTTTPILIRRPACAGFLARKVMSIDWVKFGVAVPPTGSQVWLIEACRAELDWSISDYCRIVVTSPLDNDPQYDGPHPAQRYRLPVERLAARVLNIHSHLHVGTVEIRQAIKRARRARRQYPDLQHKAPWEIDYYWPKRRELWPVFVQAAREYRAERQAVDVEQIGRVAA